MCLKLKRDKASKLNKSDLYFFYIYFFQLKIRKKTKIQNSTTISTLRIWHDPHIKVSFLIMSAQKNQSKLQNTTFLLVGIQLEHFFTSWIFWGQKKWIEILSCSKVQNKIENSIFVWCISIIYYWLLCWPTFWLGHWYKNALIIHAKIFAKSNFYFCPPFHSQQTG